MSELSPPIVATLAMMSLPLRVCLSKEIASVSASPRDVDGFERSVEAGSAHLHACVVESVKWTCT